MGSNCLTQQHTAVCGTQHGCCDTRHKNPPDLHSFPALLLALRAMVILAEGLRCTVAAVLLVKQLFAGVLRVA
jgi:hypothetical protein